MNNYIITVFRDVHTMDYYHKICIYDMALLYSRLKTGIKTVKKALKSPQCGDFLQVLVLRRRCRFVRHRKEKVRVCLENMGFCADVGAGIKGALDDKKHDEM